MTLSEHELRAAIAGLERDAAGRAFTPDERQEWNDRNAELDEFVTRRDRLREIISGRAPGHIEAGTDFGQPMRDGHRPEHVRAGHEVGLRAIEHHRGVLSPEAGDRLDGLIRHSDPVGIGGRYLDAVADPAYLTAFGKMIADSTTGHLRFSPEEVEAVRRVSQVESERAMSIGTGSAGGFAVPFQLDPTILISGTGVLNPIRQIANVETIVAHEWRGITADQIAANFTAEATEAADSSPTLVQPDLVTMKAQCFVPISIELFMDWTSLQQQLTNMISDAKNNLEATKFLTGTGTNEPGGILNIGSTGGLTTTQRVQTAVSATYAVGDPWLLKAALPPRFIPRTTYAAGPGIWDKTYRFVAQGSTTEPRQFSDGDRGGDFLGAPKVEYSPMAVTTTTGSKIIIAGDWSQYKIVDRIGMQVELIPHLFGATNRFPTGQRGIYAFWRVGAGVLMPNAFRYLEVQ
jgi:HK97 family phage major capsid protein